MQACCICVSVNTCSLGQVKQVQAFVIRCEMKISIFICSVFMLIYCPNGLGTHYGPSIVSLLPAHAVRSQQVNSMLKNVGGSWKSTSLETNVQKIEQNVPTNSQGNQVKVKLKDYPNFAVVLPIFENRPWATAMEIWRLTFPSFGEKSFSVEAPENHGVMAVVQELDIKARQHSTCNLYIKFGDSNRTTERICGKLENGDPALVPKHLIGPRAFSSPNGKMTVYFNAFPGLLGVDSYIRVAIAFTAYKEGCYFNDTDSQDYYINPRDYKPCAMRGWQSSCIKSKLFCDNVINCGEKEEFEKDEANCFKNINVEHLIPKLKINPVRIEPTHTISEHTRYLLYSHFTSSVIGIIGFFTLFFVIRYMITRTCGGGRKAKPLVEPRLQNSFTNLSSGIGTDMNIEMEERNSSESNLSPIRTSFMFGSDTNANYKLHSIARSPQDNPPSYFELFPQTEQNRANRETQLQRTFSNVQEDTL